jgi:hypothetical protein
LCRSFAEVFIFDNPNVGPEDISSRPAGNTEILGPLLDHGADIAARHVRGMSAPDAADAIGAADTAAQLAGLRHY